MTEAIRMNNENVENNNNFNRKKEQNFKIEEESDYLNLVIEYNTFLEELQKEYLWENITRGIEQC